MDHSYARIGRIRTFHESHVTYRTMTLVLRFALVSRQF